MKIIARVLGVTAVAVAGHLALVFAAGGPQEDDANIGAGLIVFAVLVGLSFVWALADGFRERTGLGVLAIRWAVVAVALPVVITLVLWVVNRTAPDWRASELFGLWLVVALMSLVPAVVGAALGYAARGTSVPGQIRSG